MNELELSEEDLKDLLSKWQASATKLESDLAAVRRKIAAAEAKLGNAKGAEAVETPEGIKKKGRNKLRILTFLKTRGSATAAEIAKETGIPLSSVYLVLKDANTFSEGGDGKWTLKK